MIKTVTITNYLEESITLNMGSPGNTGFSIISIEGLGPPKADIEMTEMSMMDGAFYNSARARSRNILFRLKFESVEAQTYTVAPPGGGASPDMELEEVVELIRQENPPIEPKSIEDIRQDSYKYFPLRKRIDIIIETDNRICTTYGFVESNEPTIFSSDEGTTISVRCPDAYLYSTDTTETMFNAIEELFEFPFSNESLSEPLLEFASIDPIVIKNIPYTGDAEVGMIFYFHAIGPVEMIDVYNTDTNEHMKIDTDRLEALTGEGMHDGDDITISTVKGDKYVRLSRDGVTTDVFNILDKFPSWFKLTKGDNMFSYNAEVGESNLQLTIQNRVAYEGI